MVTDIMTRPLRIASLLILALALILGLVTVFQRPAAANEPEWGNRLARQWCRGCHEIEPGAASDGPAPAFQVIADNPRRTPAGLKAWLSTPHAAMPDFGLSNAEVEAIIAYLNSLRGE